MAYTTPRTWVSGEHPTAAQMNANIRDNVSFVANPPSCRAYHNTTQSINNATLTTLSLNAEAWDTDTMHNTVTNNSRLTIKTAGLYIVTVEVILAANGTGVRVANLLLNGSELPINNGNAASAFDSRILYSTQEKLALNDYLEIGIYQTSGGALSTVQSATRAPSLTATWVGIG